MSNYGVCSECGTENKKHYQVFCPACYKCEPETLEYFDWFKVMHHLEVKHPGIQDRLWSDYMCEHGVNNDTYQSVWLSGENIWGDDEKSEILRNDLKLIAEAIGRPDADSVIFWISW